jgi:hypothetical protein
MVIEGESVKAYAERSNTDDKTARIWAVKEDGEVVLEGKC